METGAAEIFTTFVDDVGARLRRALISIYGPDAGTEVKADALWPAAKLIARRT